MKRVLLTGMSGTGKSSVVQALAARGYKAVDTDDGWCEPLLDGRQQWREDAIERLMAVEDADVLFAASSMISGTSSRVCARQPIMRSEPRCRSTTWSLRCCA